MKTTTFLIAVLFVAVCSDIAITYYTSQASRGRGEQIIASQNALNERLIVGDLARERLTGNQDRLYKLLSDGVVCK